MSTETIDTPGSSHLLQVAYDRETKRLEVTFVDDSIYVYESVPEATFEGFKSAGSVGQYFHRAVKNRYVGGRK